MPSRRSHSNSHHGCRQCKAKKVKCDEGQPQCSRCVKKNQACAYAHLGSAFNPFQYRPERAMKGSSDSSPNGSGSTQSPPNEDRNALLAAAKDNEQLFDHYAVVMSPEISTLSETDGFQHLDSAIRRLSRDHDYLFYNVLAFAALHLAIHTEDSGIRQAFVDIAIQHQNAALERYRPVLSNINKENCEAAVTCANLIVSCSLAIPLATLTADNNHPSKLQHLKQVISLFEGITTLYRMGWMAMLDPNISSFVLNRVVELWSEEQPAPEAEASLDSLAEKTVLKLEDSVLKDMYLLTIEKAKRTHRRLVQTTGAFTAVLFWPGAIPPHFFRVLEAEEPIALVILAHWAVCLHQIRRFWWIGSWGMSTIRIVTATLGDEWQEFLNWPNGQIA